MLRLAHGSSGGEEKRAASASLTPPLGWSVCGTPEAEASRLRQLLPEPYVLLECVSHESTLDPAHPGELAQVAGAVKRRRLEYLAGRHCARRLLDRLGLRSFPLRRSQDGAPLWPRRVVGAILHVRAGTRQFSAAAIAPCQFSAGLGIDAEPCCALPGCVWPIVFVPEELVLLQDCPAAARGLLARLLFSAKHAAMKAFRSVLGETPEYSALRLRPVHARGVYSVALGRNRRTWRASCDARFSLAAPGPDVDGNPPVLLTTVVLPPEVQRF